MILDIKAIKHFDINKIADSGQAFRFKRLGDNYYSVIHSYRYLEIKQVDSRLYLSCNNEEYYSAWRNYFDFGTNYDAIQSLGNSFNDRFLDDSIEYGKGIRILRQDFFEILISFIISQRKSIPAIKSSIEKICEKYGFFKLGKSLDGKTVSYYTFPTPRILSEATVEDLKECGVGYRAEYIIAAAKWWIKYASNWDISEIPYETICPILINDIKGVGIKVANCVCLFGLHQLKAAPVDVWIQKIITEEYENVIPEWMDSPYAGVYQQYAFYYRRSDEYNKIPQGENL